MLAAYKVNKKEIENIYTDIDVCELRYVESRYSRLSRNMQIKTLYQMLQSMTCDIAKVTQHKYTTFQL